MATEQHRSTETDRKTTKEKSKWTKRTQCSAINCKNYQCNSTNLAFHRFPKDPDRCARWVQNLRNASLMGISSQRLHQNYRVCSAHFHASQFKRPSNVHAGLKWDAVPTMVDAPNPPPPLDLELKRKPSKTRQELPLKRRKKSNIVYLPNAGLSTADSVQHPTGSETDITSPDASVARPSMPLTPLLPPMSFPTGLDAAAAAREHALKMKIRSLKVQVCKLKAEVNRLKKTRKACVNKESVMKQLRKLLPAKAYAFVSTQIHMFQRKAHGFRWTSQDKAFFLSLLHASPKCYRLLFKVFSMPSVRTLQKLMKSVDIEKTIGEHSYAKVTTDCRVDETGSIYADPPVTANVQAKAEQVEQPIDYTLDNQFDSHQISTFSSGDHGELMDCIVVIHSTCESERSGRVVNL